VVVENVFELLYPFAIGMAVDGLLDDDRTGLVVFVAVWAAHSAVSYLRQRLDSRVLGELHVRTASGLVEAQRGTVSSSVLVARTALSREFVDFVERDVPSGVAALFAFAGSIVMLAFYDGVLALAALGLVVPVVALNWRLARRSRAAYDGLNTTLESEPAVVADAPHAAVRDHFRRLAGLRVRISDAEAGTWAGLELCTIALAAFAFVRVTDITDQPGAIYATIAYLWTYVSSFDTLPALTQQVANLRDIARRFDPEST
jgi:ABC-type multidrug transport system fused ATPase/permease subunit